MKKIHWGVVLAGVAVGLAALILTAMGNPANMGFCIACFLRDTAGACGLHSAAKVQYVRPEIIGLVLGAFFMSVAGKEFKARAGSSPALRFVIGAFVVIGALAFLGCPLRMVLRLGGGDLNALVGLIGFFIGILIGIACLKRDFTLKRSYEVSVSEGSVLPTVMAALLILVLTVPTLFKASEAGPGSMHAPFWIALIVALVVGALAQKSRLCMVGGLRDAVMLGDFHLLYGFAAIFFVTLVGNLAMNKFNLGFALQPIAHSAHVWNLLGMVLVGWGSVLLGGCPLRQLILAAQGNGDSAVTVFGMLVGAALAHNFGLAGNPDSKSEAGELIVGGISTAGKIAVVLGLVVMLVVVIAIIVVMVMMFVTAAAFAVVMMVMLMLVVIIVLVMMPAAWTRRAGRLFRFIEENLRVGFDFLHLRVCRLAHFLEAVGRRFQCDFLLHIIHRRIHHTGQLLQRALHLCRAVRAVNVDFPRFLHGFRRPFRIYSESRCSPDGIVQRTNM